MLFTVQDKLDKTVPDQIAMKGIHVQTTYFKIRLFIQKQSDQEIHVYSTFYVNSTVLDSKTTFIRKGVGSFAVY